MLQNPSSNTRKNARLARTLRKRILKNKNGNGHSEQNEPENKLKELREKKAPPKKQPPKLTPENDLEVGLIDTSKLEQKPVKKKQVIETDARLLKRLDDEEVKLRAMRLRKQGMQYKAIADELGITVQRASMYVSQEIQRLTKLQEAEVKGLLAMELERLNDYLVVCYQKIIQDKSLTAIDRALRISERRAKLLGLDSPVQIQLADVTEDTSLENMSVEDLQRIDDIINKYVPGGENLFEAEFKEKTQGDENGE